MNHSNSIGNNETLAPELPQDKERLSESKSISKHSSPANQNTKLGCRFCGAPLSHVFVDLGMSPLCQTQVSADQLNAMEPFYPLKAYVCDSCFLVQLPAHVGGEEIFTSHYPYFSSYSESWLRHVKKYSDMISQRLALNSESQVVEVASNDGYMLQFFVEKGIPALGIEPARNVAEAAIQKGVPTVIKFFGEGTAKELVEEGKQADLLAGINILAHVPDLNDFVKGLKILLKSKGVITIEFPHLMRLIEGNEFDTIYQEHYCYFSFITVQQVFAAHGLTIFDVEELQSHGGSLRIYARHTEDNSKHIQDAVFEMQNLELSAGYKKLETYNNFAAKVSETKRKLIEFLIQEKRDSKHIAGYGAPGKGVTLLNYCGIREDFIDYTVDRNPVKQNTFIPGVRIPIFSPEKIVETKPDYILILPWNLKEEIMQQLAYVRNWGAKFVVPIPELTIYE